tara:strand:- start:288 stop:515 length:228 start_codon:yes stop_codon:yes gene_type:complete
MINLMNIYHIIENFIKHLDDQTTTYIILILTCVVLFGSKLNNLLLYLNLYLSWKIYEVIKVSQNFKSQEKPNNWF